MYLTKLLCEMKRKPIQSQNQLKIHFCKRKKNRFVYHVVLGHTTVLPEHK